MRVKEEETFNRFRDAATLIWKLSSVEGGTEIRAADQDNYFSKTAAWLVRNGYVSATRNPKTGSKVYVWLRPGYKPTADIVHAIVRANAYGKKKYTDAEIQRIESYQDDIISIYARTAKGNSTTFRGELVNNRFHIIVRTLYSFGILGKTKMSDQQYLYSWNRDDVDPDFALAERVYQYMSDKYDKPLKEQQYAAQKKNLPASEDKPAHALKENEDMPEDGPLFADDSMESITEGFKKQANIHRELFASKAKEKPKARREEEALERVNYAKAHNQTLFPPHRGEEPRAEVVEGSKKRNPRLARFSSPEIWAEMQSRGYIIKDSKYVKPVITYEEMD